MMDYANGYRGVRVSVLGASGFIGRWVAHGLRLLGAEVFLVVRQETAAEPVFERHQIRGSVLEADLGDLNQVGKVFQEIKPAITFNLVGYGVDRSERDEKMAYEINAHLIESICAAVAATRDLTWEGQSIVHVGSAAEYGALGNDLREDSIPQPTTLYGESKLAGTLYLTRFCRTYEIKGLTARLFTIYGPGEHRGRLLPSLIETACTENALDMTAGMQERDFTYVEDVAEGLLRLGLVKAQPGEIVNLATGRLTSVRRFAETAARILHIPDARLRFGVLPTRAGEMNHQAVNVKRLRQLTAWLPPTGIAEGVAKAVAFEKDHQQRST